MKKGFEVHFISPIKKSYDVECDDIKTAVIFATDLAKGKYPNKDWETVSYEVYPINYDNGCRTTTTPLLKA